MEPLGPDRGRRGQGHHGAQQEEGSELQVHGIGNLIQTLLRHNLVDQYRLWVFPLVNGSGKRLFSDGTIPSGLKLVDSKVSTTGVVIGTYEPACEIVTAAAILETELTAAGIPHDLKVYPGAKHAFFNDTLRNYHAGAAADSWRRVLAFFAEHVKSGHSTSS